MKKNSANTTQKKWEENGQDELGEQEEGSKHKKKVILQYFCFILFFKKNYHIVKIFSKYWFPHCSSKNW